jgi:hypothetical protein
MFVTLTSALASPSYFIKHLIKALRVHHPAKSNNNRGSKGLFCCKSRVAGYQTGWTLPPGFLHNALRSSSIPFHGRGKPWIELRFAFCQFNKFQGTSDGYNLRMIEQGNDFVRFLDRDDSWRLLPGYLHPLN